ncbi:hypothetical protein F5148DRAFT_1149107 [Russula earlei]|uniref:Uncharacterized protein n=1 Tax=Russula earlei TaxID=71964 RepID=A0ACC0U9W0_9AGAM|nr:hypothetical protein F5148DRAFT_1149107 [Russula earlei]
MSTPNTVKQLVKDISSLSSSLLDTVPRGSKDDKIWIVMILVATFTIHQGNLRMGLVVSYPLKINWTNFPLDLIELKLEHLIAELKHLQQVDVPYPVQTLNPTVKLKDAANMGGDPNAPSSASAVPTPPNKHNITSVADNNSDGEDGIVDQAAQSKRDTEWDIHDKGIVFLNDDKSVTLGNPQAIDMDGLHMDVDVQPVNDSSSTHEDKHQDVDNFFQMAVVKEVNGKSKQYHVCKICQ